MISLLLGAALAGGCSKSATASAPTAATGAAAGKAPLKVALQLDWYPVTEHGGYFEALTGNYYRDAGLVVSIEPGGPGCVPLQLVGTGRSAFAIGRCDDVMLAARQGLPLVIVCAQMEHDPQAIMMHEDGDVKSFQDLDGKAVNCGPGANWMAAIQARYNVHFSVIPTDYGLARFMADKNYVQQCFISNEPYLVGLHGVKTRTLLIAGGGYDPYRVVFTSKGFAESHPDVVRAFVKASIRGWSDFLHGDASGARAKILSENSSQTPGMADYSLEAMKTYRLVEGDPAKGERIGLITPARMTALMNTLVDLRVLDAPMPLDRFVSFDFLPADMRAR